MILTQDLNFKIPELNFQDIPLVHADSQIARYLQSAFPTTKESKCLYYNLAKNAKFTRVYGFLAYSQ